MKALEYVHKFYQGWDIKDLLINYVDRDFWTEKINEFFSGDWLYNRTDFTNSKCFKFFIDLSRCGLYEENNNIEDLLKNKEFVYSLEIQISTIDSYICCAFKRHFLIDDLVQSDKAESPWFQEDEIYLEKLSGFAESISHQILSRDDLIRRLPGVRLDSAKNDATIYEFLFADDLISE